MSYGAAQYKSTHTETATPIQIVVQLYDGAVRFMRQGAEHMRTGRMAQKGNALNRAHAIISELQATLDHSQAPELCTQLEALYDFVLHRIIEANAQAKPDHLDAAINVMVQLRGAWQELAQNQSQGQAQPKAR